MSPAALDLVVLGAGSGGLACALRAARLGARVAVLEPALPGGTCVNLGCVPKKVMWEAAALAAQMPRARHLGIDVPARPQVDWAALVAARQAYIERIHASYLQQLQALGVELVATAGRLAGNGAVAMDDGRRLQARHIVLATGARPRRPEIEGAGLLAVSDDVFAWTRRPQRVAVIGGGYIGVELACLLQALGSEVHLLVHGQRLLGGFDAELAAALAEAMGGHGVQIHWGATVKSARGGPGALQLGGDNVPGRVFDALVAATGRQPNVQSLGLAAAGVACDDKGFIRTDPDSLATSAAGIWAVGDVSGQLALTPMAVAQGRRLAEALFGTGAGPAIDPQRVPSVVFSHPPLGRAGLDEAAARKQFDQVNVYRASFRALAEAAGGGDQRHLFKVVCAGPEQTVVGVHLLGERCEEMLQGFAVAVQCGLRWEQFRQTLAIHPTAAEEVVLAQ